MDLTEDLRIEMNQCQRDVPFATKDSEATLSSDETSNKTLVGEVEVDRNSTVTAQQRLDPVRACIGFNSKSKPN